MKAIDREGPSPEKRRCIRSGDRMASPARFQALYAKALAVLKSKALGDSLFLVGGALAAQGMFFLAAPVITRLFRPADLGLLATTMSLVLLGRQLATLNYHQAIPVVPGERTSRRLATLTLTTSVGFVVLVTLILGLGAVAPIPGVFGQWLDAMWWVAPLMLLALCVNDVVSYSVTRSGPIRALGEARLGQGAAYVGGQVIAGFLLPVASLLCLAYAAGFAASNAWLLFRRHGRAILAVSSPARLWSLARRFHRYPRYIMPSNLMAQAGTELPSLLIASLYGLREAGLFFLTVRIIGLFNQMLGESATWITYARMAEMARTDPGALRRFTFRFAGIGVFVGGPIVVILAGVAAWLAPWLLGPEYREVGWIIMLVSLSLPFQIFLLPFAALNILGAEALQMKTLIGRLALITVCVATPALLGLSFVWVVAGYALGMSMAFMLVFFVWVRALSGEGNVGL